MSYAVIRTGGKQYRVSEGQVLQVEKLEGEAGEEVVFGDVLLAKQDDETILTKNKLAPITVKAQIVRQGRGRKLHILKFKRRQGYQRRMGHRQSFTEVRIESIS